MIGVGQREAWHDNAVCVSEHCRRRLPDRIGVSFLRVAATPKRQPRRLGAHEPARFPILVAPRSGRLALRREAGPRVPPVRRLLGCRVEGKDREHLDLRPGARCPCESPGEGEHRVVDMW